MNKKKFPEGILRPITNPEERPKVTLEQLFEYRLRQLDPEGKWAKNDNFRILMKYLWVTGFHAGFDCCIGAPYNPFKEEILAFYKEMEEGPEPE